MAHEVFSKEQRALGKVLFILTNVENHDVSDLALCENLNVQVRINISI